MAPAFHRIEVAPHDIELPQSITAGRVRPDGGIDRLCALFRRLLYRNYLADWRHHRPRSAWLRRPAAAVALPISNSNLLDRTAVLCRRVLPDGYSHRVRHLSLGVYLVPHPQHQGRARP